MHQALNAWWNRGRGPVALKVRIPGQDAAGIERIGSGEAVNRLGISRASCLSHSPVSYIRLERNLVGSPIEMLFAPAYRRQAEPVRSPSCQELRPLVLLCLVVFLLPTLSSPSATNFRTPVVILQPSSGSDDLLAKTDQVFKPIQVDSFTTSAYDTFCCTALP